MKATTYMYLSLLLPSILVTNAAVVVGYFDGLQAGGIVVLSAVLVALFIRGIGWYRFYKVFGRRSRRSGCLLWAPRPGGSSVERRRTSAKPSATADARRCWRRKSG